MLAGMEYKIKIRSRAKLPTPWKWEIHGDRLITSEHESYASRDEAYWAGQAVLARMVQSNAEREGCPPNALGTPTSSLNRLSI
jgi:hypothetical protein